MPEADERPKAQVIDLMEALKASLGKRKDSPNKRAAPQKSAKARNRA
jgi:non-homologous end joining protein Ku